MEIKTYTPAQLKHFIASSQFAQMPVVPISTQRALSQIANPRAVPDDVLLIIAFEKDEMAGYLGVLPDLIYNQHGEVFKCGWMSCLWVSPAFRGKGVAKLLLQHVFNEWKGNIMATEFTAEAKNLYYSSGNFDDLTTLYGLNCYLHFNLHEILPKKNPWYQKFAPLLKVADLLANIPNNFRLNSTKRAYAFNAKFERVNKIDEALNQFIALKQSTGFEKRQATELNWILNQPWIKQSEPTGESKRYHFTSVANRFENLCFKLEAGGKIVGFVLLTLRNNHLKIPYAYFDDEYAAELVEFIYKTMHDFKVNMLTVFQTDLVDYISSHASPFIYKRRITRPYLMSKTLAPPFKQNSNLDIQDGDGDCAFT